VGGVAAVLEGAPISTFARIGIISFCFGGRCALLFAAASPAIRAVVSFHGNLRTPLVCQSQGRFTWRAIGQSHL
jgi:dienelactone hydrolase